MEETINKKLMVLVILCICISVLTAFIATNYYTDKKSEQYLARIDEILAGKDNSEENERLTISINYLAEKIAQLETSDNQGGFSDEDMKDILQELRWLREDAEDNNKEVKDELKKLRNEIDGIDVNPIVYVTPVY